MEKIITKIFLALLIVSTLVWIGTMSVRMVTTGYLFKFETAEFKEHLEPSYERMQYHAIAKYAVINLICYPIVFLSAVGYLKTTKRTFKQEGWMLMSALLFFLFVPVEIYCMILDWKIIGLNFWGSWPLEEFRKAFLRRITAFGGAQFLAVLSYFTIIVFIYWKPLRKN